MPLPPSYLAKKKFQQAEVSGSIRFKIKNAGLNVDGKLGGFEGHVQFDPENLAESQISGTAKTETIDTGLGMRDNHLRKSDYFHVAKYPEIKMQSKEIRHKSGEEYEGTFELTIRDKTQKIELPFSRKETGGQILYKASFQIDRRDFGVGGRSMLLSDDITVFVEIKHVPKKS